MVLPILSCYNSDMSKSSKTILVVGASGGIGNKVAEVLLHENYSVIGTYYQHPVRVENFKNSPYFTPKHLDLTDIEEMKSIIDKNNLYAVVNCAGIVEFEVDDIATNIDIWNKTLAVNLSGNYYLAQILGSNIVKKGRFIMISSTDSYFGGAITASYAASKSGINSLTKSLSLLLQSKKIRVNSIAPGWVETPMILDNGDEFIKKVATINPLKRNAKPLDVANLISFLLSDKADYINGQVISLEGGYTNQDPTLLLEEEGK